MVISPQIYLFVLEAKSNERKLLNILALCELCRPPFRQGLIYFGDGHITLKPYAHIQGEGKTTIFETCLLSVAGVDLLLN